MPLMQWYQEVSQANPKALKFFVGTKIDERSKTTTGKVVSTNEGNAKIEQ